ncbi:protease modulator HflC [Treponema pedis]|uniref:protease modulator HflC n=1 Tax=Treponema pedis TaxID=409322 RepID=UPI00040DDBD8|nr:protease modulator HflC [Treponema pedis]
MNNDNYENVNANGNKIKPEKAKSQKGLKFFILFVVILVLVFFSSPFYILNEGEFALITQLGKIVGTEKVAGLHFKIPLIQTVNRYSAKLLRLDGDPQRVLTQEQQFIEVDTTSRWRIVDIRKFYESVVTYEGAFSKLSDIIDSAVRDVISINSLDNVVRTSNIIKESKHKEKFDINTEEVDITSLPNEKNKIADIEKGRDTLAYEILQRANKQLGEFGVEVIDVIFKQIKYSDELQNSVFNRMIKDRNQIAQTFRSTGEGKKAEWLGKLENEKKNILSKAYAEAEKIKGDADAKALSIYAQSYGKSPEFYSFWKSIEMYKTSLPKTEKILSTDMEYFKYLYQH